MKESFLDSVFMRIFNTDLSSRLADVHAEIYV